MSSGESPVEWVVRTRVEQGLQPEVNDGRLLKRVHYLIRSTCRSGDVRSPLGVK